MRKTLIRNSCKKQFRGFSKNSFHFTGKKEVNNGIKYNSSKNIDINNIKINSNLENEINNTLKKCFNK